MHPNRETAMLSPLISVASSSTVIQCFLHTLEPNYCLGNLIEINAYVTLNSLTPRNLTVKDF
jgi:hypothetical protein